MGANRIAKYFPPAFNPLDARSHVADVEQSQPAAPLTATQSALKAHDAALAKLLVSIEGALPNDAEGDRDAMHIRQARKNLRAIIREVSVILDYNGG